MSSVEFLKLLKAWLILYSNLLGECSKNGDGIKSLRVFVVAVKEC